MRCGYVQKSDDCRNVTVHKLRYRWLPSKTTEGIIPFQFVVGRSATVLISEKNNEVSGDRVGRAPVGKNTRFVDEVDAPATSKTVSFRRLKVKSSRCLL